MKEKLLAALKLKFVGASDATLSRIADKKAGSVTEESQIQPLVDGITWEIVVQSEVDARIAVSHKKVREETVKEYEEAHKLKDGKPIDTADSKDKKDSTGDSETAKLLKQFDELKNMFTQQQAKQTQQQLLGKLTAKLKDKVPEKHLSKLLGNRTIEKEEDIETVAAEIETTWTELKQEFTNESVPPGPGGGGLKPAALASELQTWRKDKGLPEKPEIKKT